MFNNQILWRYAVIVTLLGVASYYGMVVSNAFSSKEKDEYEMVKQYLLNDSPLYGYNRPKIWIHTTYEMNARKWKDFYSRNTRDLNQPYLHFTIKSIIQACGDDFHICLIDDDSFSKLIPTWTVDLQNMPDPVKSQYRQYGLAQLIYYYGGILVPNSFLCLRSLKSLWDDNSTKPFVCEKLNRSLNQHASNPRPTFIPDTYFMGARKNDPVVLEYVEYLHDRASQGVFTNEYEFAGDTSIGSFMNVKKGKMALIGGELIGIRTSSGKPILLEELIEDNYLPMSSSLYGIYIPADEFLRRTKYQWFSVMETEQLLESNLFISRYMKKVIVDSSNTEMKSTIAL